MALTDQTRTRPVTQSTKQGIVFYEYPTKNDKKRKQCCSSKKKYNIFPLVGDGHNK